MNNPNPVDRKVFDLIDGVSDLVTNAHRLKAVTQAFSSAFAECEPAAAVTAVRANPETYCYLFNVLEEYVYTVTEQAEALDTQGSNYLRKQWA